MPNFANVILTDAATPTPVNRTFEPTRTAYGTDATWNYRGPAIPAGWNILFWSVKDPSSKSGPYRVTGSLAMPTVITVNGVDTVVRTSKFNMAFDFAPDSSEQERSDLHAMVSDWLSEALFKESTKKLTPFYS
jgi:hypothetical protein